MLKKILIPALFAAYSVLPATAADTINESNLFDDGPNESWTRVITLASASDGSSSRSIQTLDINATFILPVVAGCQYRVYKTTQDGSDYFGTPQTLNLGANSISVPSVGFDRTVKIQFSSGTVGFNSLVINGDTQYPGGVAVTRSATIDNSYLFEDTTNSTWTKVISLAKLSDGISSQLAQNLTFKVTSLPAGGANYRVVKSTANESYYNAPAVSLTEGIISIDVSSVPFDRAVKIQFTSGEIEFNDLSVNSVTQYPGPPKISLIGDTTVDAFNGSTYTDQGATAVDDIGDPVIPVLTGSVDTSTLGDYVLTYTATDVNGESSTETRTVTVITADTEDPVVTVNGQSSLSITQGDVFTDAGATITDNSGEDITPVVTGDTVDINTPGVYTITYTATDSSGNSGSATRTVTVVEVDTDGDGVVDSLDVHGGFDDALLTTYLSENGYSTGGLTQQDFIDLRVGSTMIDASSGSAVITIQLEQNTDINDPTGWTDTGSEGQATLTVPISGDCLLYTSDAADDC